MMMFKVCSAFSLSLIALAVGMALVVLMRVHKDHTSKMCRGVAYFVVILAFLTVICVGYYGTKYWVYGGSYRVHQNMQSYGKCTVNGCQGVQSNQHMMRLQMPHKVR